MKYTGIACCMAVLLLGVGTLALAGNGSVKADVLEGYRFKPLNIQPIEDAESVGFAVFNTTAGGRMLVTAQLKGLPAGMEFRAFVVPGDVWDQVEFGQDVQTNSKGKLKVHFNLPMPDSDADVFRAKLNLVHGVSEDPLEEIIFTTGAVYVPVK